MYILLIVWFLFLFIYIIFNVYSLYRVMATRIKGDATGIASLVYIVAILFVIVVSVILLSSLDWNQSLNMFRT